MQSDDAIRLSAVRPSLGRLASVSPVGTAAAVYALGYAPGRRRRRPTAPRPSKVASARSTPPCDGAGAGMGKDVHPATVHVPLGLHASTPRQTPAPSQVSLKVQARASSHALPWLRGVPMQAPIPLQVSLTVQNRASSQSLPWARGVQSVPEI